MENTDLLIQRQQLLLVKHQLEPEGGVPGKDSSPFPDHGSANLILP